MNALSCEAHRQPTRLTCVTCGEPICPRCLVATRVGFKCRSHPAAGAEHRSPRSHASPVPPRAGRRPPPTVRGTGGGFFRFFPFIVLLWLVPVLLSPMEALFEATAHWTGPLAVAPLVAVLVVVVGGGLLVATKASRRL